MKIGIPLSKSAYTPESYAYHSFLINKGFSVQLDYNLDPNNDINIHYMGLDPIWEKENGRSIVIHEYQSLSTPPFSKVKNFIKKNVNKKPSGRIFLNEVVKKDMSFKDRVPYLKRDMGIDKHFFQNTLKDPEFDIIYCGSIAGRVGLISEIIRLSLLGFTIQVVGRVDLNTMQNLRKYNNIKLWGQVSREYLPELYRNSRYGLNFTPDIYPFNIQTSTKVLEYIASNLIVLSNKYEWISDFSENNSIDVIWIDKIDNKSKIYERNLNTQKNNFIKDLEWNILLDKSDFHTFLLGLVNN